MSQCWGLGVWGRGREGGREGDSERERAREESKHTRATHTPFFVFSLTRRLVFSPFLFFSRSLDISLSLSLSTSLCLATVSFSVSLSLFICVLVSLSLSESLSSSLPPRPPPLSRSHAHSLCLSRCCLLRFTRTLCLHLSHSFNYYSFCVNPGIMTRTL
jgi:hypothetical protein